MDQFKLVKLSYITKKKKKKEIKSGLLWTEGFYSTCCRASNIPQQLHCMVIQSNKKVLCAWRYASPIQYFIQCTHCQYTHIIIILKIQHSLLFLVYTFKTLTHLCITAYISKFENTCYKTHRYLCYGSPREQMLYCQYQLLF